MPGLKITQQNIADALNISRATVSKVFNNKPLPDKVRETVLEKARELGYSLSRNDCAWEKTAGEGPQALKPSGLILLICFPPENDPQKQNAANNMSRWKKLVSGMERACLQNGYHLIVSVLAGLDEGSVQLLDKYTLSKVEGSILCGSSSKISAFLEGNASKRPAVIADADDLGYLNYKKNDVVVYDIIGAMSEIVTHFAKAGHKRVAYIGAPNAYHTLNERRMGLLYGCMENGIEADISFLDDLQPGQTWQDRFELKIASEGRLPTAFACESDAVALEAKAILERRGYHAPGDFCLSGFDGADESSLENGITTTLFYREELGYHAVEQLLYRIKSPNHPILMIRQRIKVVFQCPMLPQAYNTEHIRSTGPRREAAPA